MEGSCDCGVHAAAIVKFKDGTSKLVCPEHLHEYVPTVAIPSWCGRSSEPEHREDVASVALYPEEEYDPMAAMHR